MSVIFLMILSKKSQQELYGSPAGYLVVMFFNMLMIFTIIVICKKLLKGRAKDKTIRLTTVEWMGFLLMPLCSIVTLILLVDYSMKSNEVSLWLLAAVSYTHLDVYKRQPRPRWPPAGPGCARPPRGDFPRTAAASGAAPPTGQGPGPAPARRDPRRRTWPAPCR